MIGPDAAIVLAGGSGRRLGGRDKAALTRGGRSLLDLALDAVAGARVVVVGPKRRLNGAIIQIREDPPGSGPAAALVSGLAALQPSPGELVAVLAADHPGVSRALVELLTAALRNLSGVAVAPGVAGARAAGPDGRGQALLSVWRAEALVAAAGGRSDWTDQPVHRLLGDLTVVDLAVAPEAVADIDTPEDLAHWLDG